MRLALAAIAVLVIASLPVTAQTISRLEAAGSLLHETQSDASCSSPHVRSQGDPSPKISFAGVSFSGALQLPVQEQNQVAESIKRETSGVSVGIATDKALERVRTGWQDRGYFKVQVTGAATTIAADFSNQRLALFVQVDEGPQYRLAGITFKNNRSVTNMRVLRSLFPIRDGSVFSREKIAKGLEELRRLYGTLGFINFTSVPNTMLDEETKLITLTIDVDEGKQFYIGSVNVLGLNEFDKRKLLKEFPAGQIYNSKLFQLFLKEHSSLLQFSPDDPNHVRRQLNERAGTVAITIDARVCGVD